jgi:hypothetical protein
MIKEFESESIGINQETLREMQNCETTGSFVCDL